MLKKSGILFVLLIMVLAACAKQEEPNTSVEPAAESDEEETKEHDTGEEQLEEKKQEVEKEEADEKEEDSHSPFDVSAPNVSAPDVEAPEVSAPEISAPEVTVSQEGEEVIINMPDHLLFDFDESMLREDARVLLEEISSELEQYEAADISIHGHTDNQGDAAYNQQLSQKRAEAVETYLLEEQGLDQFSFSTKGFGEREPAAPNDNEENRAKNRRVEMIIIPKEA